MFKRKILFTLVKCFLLNALLFAFMSEVVFGNPYHLEQSQTGSEVLNLSAGPYEFEVGVGGITGGIAQ